MGKKKSWEEDDQSSLLLCIFINGDCVHLGETPFNFDVSPELTEVFSEDLQSPLQKVLDGISLLHLQVEDTQRHDENIVLLFDQTYHIHPHEYLLLLIEFSFSGFLCCSSSDFTLTVLRCPEPSQ